MYGYIYETKNLINNKYYIGQHKSTEFDNNYLGSGTYITRSIRKYGKVNFSVKILEECISQKHLDLKEQYYIKEYIKKYGQEMIYNITTGGRKNNVWEYLSKEDKMIFRQKCRNGHRTEKFKKYCEDTKSIRSIAQSKRMLGHKVSEESKLKASISNKGQKRKPETCKKMSQVWHSTHNNICLATTKDRKCVTKNDKCKYVKKDEVEKYIQEGWILGNKLNSKKNLGKKRSIETRLRISNSLKGKPKSDEHKKKISETLMNKSKKIL